MRTLLLAAGGLAVLLTTGMTVSRQPIFVVNSTDDSRNDGCTAEHCSLREAILAANARRGAEIRFDLPHWPHRPSCRPLGRLRGSRVRERREPAGRRIVCRPCKSRLGHVAGDGQQPGDLGRRQPSARAHRHELSGHGVVVNGNEKELRCLFVGVGPTCTEPQGNGGHGIAASAAIPMRSAARTSGAAISCLTTVAWAFTSRTRSTRAATTTASAPTSWATRSCRTGTPRSTRSIRHPHRARWASARWRRSVR